MPEKRSLQKLDLGISFEHKHVVIQLEMTCIYARYFLCNTINETDSKLNFLSKSTHRFGFLNYTFSIIKDAILFKLEMLHELETMIMLLIRLELSKTSE